MKIRSYFAASNGYAGFKSYFDRIFNPESYEHTFVIKGGPGTGKSTLMKRIASTAKNLSANHDLIHCASDPQSLDGVIVYSDRGKFAVIDGTAPHERDATIPGAIDSIVNVGDGLNRSFLKEHRAEIVSLNRLKKNSYASAYSTLKAAGAISERITTMLAENFDYKRAQLLADGILDSSDKKDSRPRLMLRETFCKLGRHSTDAFEDLEKVYFLSGKYGEEGLFMKIMHEKSKQICNSISLDPLDTSYINAFSTDKCSYIIGNKNNQADLDLESLIKKTASKSELSHLKSEKDRLLESARYHFSEAAKHHFELEAIYSQSASFSRNDEIYDEIINTIF